MKKLTEIPSVKIYAILQAIKGPDGLIDIWWNTPHKAFGLQCPKDVHEFTVLQYLLEGKETT